DDAGAVDDVVAGAAVEDLLADVAVDEVVAAAPVDLVTDELGLGGVAACRPAVDVVAAGAAPQVLALGDVNKRLSVGPAELVLGDAIGLADVQGGGLCRYQGQAKVRGA